MGLDYSIPLQQTQVQMPNVMAMQANAMQMQNAMNQNRMGELQYQNAMRANQDDELARQVYAEVGGDPKKAIEALRGRGLLKHAATIEDGLLKRREQLSKIDQTELETALKKMETLGGLLAPLKAKGDAVSHDDIFDVIKVGQGLGVVDQGFVSQVPMNKMALPQWIQTSVMGTKKGLDSLKALSHEIQYLNVGGQRIPVNMNPNAAGGVGPVAGMAPIANTMTPAEVKADERAKEAAARDKYGDPKEFTGADGKPRLVMQRKGDGVLVDANTKEPVDGVGPKLGEAAQKQKTGVETTRAAITEYRAALKDWKAEHITMPGKRARMGTDYNNMLLQAKEAFQLGVLNGPDYKILQDVITDPASLKGGITSKSDLDAQAKKLDEIMGRIGATVTEQQAGVKAGAPKRIKTDAEFNALPSGAVFIDPEGNQRRKP